MEADPTPLYIRVHNVPTARPLYGSSLPSPHLQLCDGGSVTDLVQWLAKSGNTLTEMQIAYILKETIKVSSDPLSARSRSAANTSRQWVDTLCRRSVKTLRTSTNRA